MGNFSSRDVVDVLGLEQLLKCVRNATQPIHGLKKLAKRYDLLNEFRLCADGRAEVLESLHNIMVQLSPGIQSAFAASKVNPRITTIQRALSQHIGDMTVSPEERYRNITGSIAALAETCRNSGERLQEFQRELDNRRPEEVNKTNKNWSIAGVIGGSLIIIAGLVLAAFVPPLGIAIAAAGAVAVCGSVTTALLCDEWDQCAHLAEALAGANKTVLTQSASLVSRALRTLTRNRSSSRRDRLLSHDEISITFKTLDGIVFHIVTLKSTTFQAIKADHLARRLGNAAPDAITIIYEGRCMEDHNTPAGEGCLNETVMHVIVGEDTGLITKEMKAANRSVTAMLKKELGLCNQLMKLVEARMVNDRV